MELMHAKLTAVATTVVVAEKAVLVSTATGNLRNGDPGGNGGSAGEHGADRGGADAEVVLTEVALAEGGAGTR